MNHEMLIRAHLFIFAGNLMEYGPFTKAVYAEAERIQQELDALAAKANRRGIPVLPEGPDYTTAGPAASERGNGCRWIGPRQGAPGRHDWN